MTKILYLDWNSFAGECMKEVYFADKIDCKERGDRISGHLR